DRHEMGKHAVSFHSYWRGITTTALLLIFRCGWAEEVVHGRVSGVGTPSSETDSGLPPSLNVNLSIAADDLQLNFTKDTDIDPDLPVFGLYQDIKNGAAVGISQEMDQNGTSHFHLEGVLHSKGKVYDVRNVQQNPNAERRHRRDVSDNVTSDGEDQEFVLKLHEDFSPDNFDSIRKPPFILKKKTMAPFRNITRPLAVQVPTAPPLRHKREVTQDVYIDVVAIADYAVYVDWYDRSTKTTQSEKKQEALENIRQYYAFVFNGINLMYKSIVRLPYTIHVKLSSVIVSTSGSASQWTENYRVTSPQWDEVDANSALSDLSNWARTTDLLPAYDHIMLFSGYDLTRPANGGTSDKITGLAYTATLCDTNGKASSIVEDLGGFQCMSTAAHELGHSLSAEHDGSENSCTSTDRYIMAAGTNPETEANKLNPWLFSPCSINYFNNFLTDEVRYNRGRTCLYQSLTANPNVPDVTSEMPGQLYDADAQCRQVYGPESRLCRGPEFGQPEDVCTDMYCYDPTTSSTCFMLVAARGTSCGNKKWCDGGQCVYNSAAPALNENCVFGDQPGIAFSEQDCPTFVDNFPGYCYQEVVRGRCCGSCARYYNPVQNCEYGDRAAGCSSFGCSRGETSYLESCCGTCNYGTCVDDPTITINQQSCSALVSSGPEYCYNERVNSYCCASCRLIYTGVTGCEFGDYNSSYCAGEGTSSCGLFFTDGSSFDAYCCGTCEYIPPTLPPSTPTFVATTTEEACVDDIGNSACAQVSRARHVCYNATLASLCCATCSRLSNNRPGCEFGDISPTECAVLTPGSDYCRNLTSQCCQTCGVDATGAQDRASSSIVMVVLAVSTVILSFKSFRAL
ncbi:hypothetical protein BaRGS_00039707, partial [Batillaria attramentaria]